MFLHSKRFSKGKYNFNTVLVDLLVSWSKISMFQDSICIKTSYGSISCFVISIPVCTLSPSSLRSGMNFARSMSPYSKFPDILSQFLVAAANASGRVTTLYLKWLNGCVPDVHGPGVNSNSLSFCPRLVHEVLIVDSKVSLLLNASAFSWTYIFSHSILREE